MSGNSEDPGCKLVRINSPFYYLDANNPSDLIKSVHKGRSDLNPIQSDAPSSSKAGSSKAVTKNNKKFESDASSDEYEEAKPAEPVSKEQLAVEMREEHGFKFKTGVLHGIRVDEGLKVVDHFFFQQHF